MSAPKRRYRQSTPIHIRFWRQVERRNEGECWPWIGSKDRAGYGGISEGPGGCHNLRAHRVSWELHHGEIPDGQQVCHRCDNPPCVNPAHLFIGTAKDNKLDEMRKGRHIQGERQHLAKFTEAQVQEIRALYAAGGVGLRTIAKRYGASSYAVWSILKRLTWKHVP